MQRLFPENTFVAPQMPDPKKDLVRLVIAEAPGSDEQEKGIPLVGGAGRWFDNMAAKAGIDRAGLTVTNCISCRPPNNVFPTDPEAKSYISREDADAAIQHCRAKHLDPLLRGRKWKRIDLLGDKPLRLVAGLDGGIFRWRGSPVAVPGLGTDPIAIPTLHPAYIARDQQMIPAVINDLKKPLDQLPEHYKLFPSLDEVRAFNFPEFAFDIETFGWSKDIRCVGLCARPSFSLTVPFRGPYIAELKRIFREATGVIGHNSIQFDHPLLETYDVKVSPECQLWDTMLLQHLCFPDFPHDLEFLASQFTTKPAWKDVDRGAQFYWELRCNRDTDVTLQSFRQLKPLTEQLGLMDLYQNIQVPLAKICRLMTDTGFKVNPNRIGEVRKKLNQEMAQAEMALPEPMRTHEVDVKRRHPAPPGTLGKSGKPVKYILVPAKETVCPWRSTEVKKKYLYSTDEPWCLGLPAQFDPKDPTKVTTGKTALEKLGRKYPEHHRALNALRNLNKWDELLTTFASQEMLSVDRMHPHFNVHGTGSGRLSSSDPNLQNIPESSRFIYVPSHAGWKLLQVDYSGIENRITAYLAGDVARLDRLVRNPKFSEHKLLASRITGVPYDEIEKSADPDSPYIKAKHVVHGCNYGLGPLKAARMYDMDLRETKELFAFWKKEIAPTIRWQERVAEEARRTGVLTTVFGRKRFFYTSSYYTEALSFLPQSTAADIIFRAMIGLMYDRIGWPRERALQVAKVVEALPQPARLLLQVHDALIFEYPPEIEDQLVATVQRVMCQGWAELGGLDFPIGIETGESWGELEPYSNTSLRAGV